MIRITACLALMIGLPSIVLADADDEMKKLEGAWKVNSAEADAKPFDLRMLGMTQVVIQKGKITFENNGKALMSFALTIDPSRKPKHMNWKKEGEPNPLPTIYALEGDELKLCFPLLPKKGSGDQVEITRPGSFETKGKPILTLTLKRGKK